MKLEPGGTPFEVELVFQLHPDYNLAVRCLEYIRVNFGSIVPGCGHLRVQLIPLCHHSSSNCYPALSIVGDYPELTYDRIQEFGALINAWVKSETLQSVISKAKDVSAPTWADLSKGGCV